MDLPPESGRSPQIHRVQFFIFVALVLIASTSLYFLGWSRFWSALHTRPILPPFADMRTVQGGVISVSHGFAPQIANPYDPFHRPMDYPSVWLWIGRVFSLQEESHYLFFCGFSVVAFLSSCAYLLFRFPSWWLLLAAISPASLLVIERGNNDMDAFWLLIMFAGASRWLSIAPFLLAVSAKLFPLFAIHAVVARRDIPRAAAMIAAVLFLFFLLRNEIVLMLHGNSAQGAFAYGAKILWAMLTIPSAASSSVGRFLLQSATLTAAVGISVASLLLAPNRRNDTPTHRFFMVGAVIYNYTYLLAANWHYRLIFLIMCVPYLAEDELGIYGRVTLAALILALSAPWIAFQGPVLPVVLLADQAVLFILLLPLILTPLLPVAGRGSMPWMIGRRH